MVDIVTSHMLVQQLWALWRFCVCIVGNAYAVLRWNGEEQRAGVKYVEFADKNRWSNFVDFAREESKRYRLLYLVIVLY